MRPTTILKQDMTLKSKPMLNWLFVSNLWYPEKKYGIIVMKITFMFSKQLILKKIGQLLLHFLFWTGVLFFYTYFFGMNNAKFEDTLLFSLFLMPTTIATTYVSTYKLIPEYLITKQYWKFALYSTYTFIVSLYSF